MAAFFLHSCHSGLDPESRKKQKTLPRLRRGGFALVELLIYIALVAFILLAATAFALEFVAANAKATAIQEVNRNARFALARIELEIREARDLCPSKSVFNTSGSPCTTTCKLALLKSSGSSCLTDGDRIEFDIDAATNQLRLKDPATSGGTSLTSTRVKISELIFEDFSLASVADVVRVRIKAEYTPPAGSTLPMEQTASTTVETTAVVQRGEGVAP